MAPAHPKMDDKSEPTLVVGPKTKPTGLVVVFHGSGGSCYCFEDLATFWSESTQAKFILPSAPMRGDKYRNWMCKLTATQKCVRLNGPWLQALQFIEEQRMLHGIPFSRIVLVGFSAGARMASWVALNLPCAIGGLVLLSGRVHKEGEMPAPRMAPGVEKTPVLYLCGSADGQVPERYCREDAERLLAKGFTVHFQTFADVEHEIVQEEIDIVQEFLAGVFSTSRPASSRAEEEDRAAGVILRNDIKHLSVAVAARDIYPVVLPMSMEPRKHATDATMMGCAAANARQQQSTHRAARRCVTPRSDKKQPMHHRAGSACATPPRSGQQQSSYRAVSQRASPRLRPSS